MAIGCGTWGEMTVALCEIYDFLAERHPGLSRDQHHGMIITAVHEASHLVAALVLETGTVWPEAYIRVPGRNSVSGGHRGIDGKVLAHGALWEDVIIELASLPAAKISLDPNAKRSCFVDKKSAMQKIRINCEYGGVAHIEKQVFRELTAQSVNLVVKHWPVIELAATEMLRVARKTGDIKNKAMSRVIEKTKNALSEPRYTQKLLFEVKPEFYRIVEVAKQTPSVLNNVVTLDENIGYPTKLYW